MTLQTNVSDLMKQRPVPQMVNYVAGIVFVVLVAIGFAILQLLRDSDPRIVSAAAVAWLVLSIIVSSAIRLAAEWERAVVFRLGRFHAVKGPGLFGIIPLFDQLRSVDTRVQALQISKQQVITKDNVPVTIDGVLFFKVSDPSLAIIRVQDFRFAISQYARTSLRDVIGQMTLDQLLAEREEIERAIGLHVEKDTSDWGLHVVGIRMEDIDMPEDLKKMMSRQASAEREKRATITKAEGDRDAAVNLSAAAQTMRESPGAMQLRTLQTLDGLGPTASNTVIIAVPIEILDALRSMGAAAARKAAA
ncbi:MAG: SPFH domain-containing protein [Acidobacteriota bacterium]